MGVEPVRHFGLVFCGGVFVPEDVGNLALFAVVGARYGALAVLRGPLGMRKESQKSLCLSEMVLGERVRCEPSSVGMEGDR
jgi:hypothetical protein